MAASFSSALFALAAGFTLGAAVAGAEGASEGADEFSALNFSTNALYTASSSLRISPQTTAYSGAVLQVVKRSVMVARQCAMKANQARWPTAAGRFTFSSLGAFVIISRISLVIFFSSSRGRADSRARAAVMGTEDILGVCLFLGGGHAKRDRGSFNFFHPLL